MTAVPLQIEIDLISRIISDELVPQVIGRNAEFREPDDQLAVRAGNLEQSDPYPGAVCDLVSIEHNKDLNDCGNLQVAKFEVRCLAFDKTQAWTLRNAIAYGTGDPADPTRTTGLDKYRDESKQIFGVSLENDERDPLHINTDGTDRILWTIETTYHVEFRERKVTT